VKDEGAQQNMPIKIEKKTCHPPKTSQMKESNSRPRKERGGVETRGRVGKGSFWGLGGVFFAQGGRKSMKKTDKKTVFPKKDHGTQSSAINLNKKWFYPLKKSEAGERGRKANKHTSWGKKAKPEKG